MNPHYTRVIPRDLFNEANLLKCLGRLSLLILDNAAPDGMKLNYEPDMELGEGFHVTMDENSGSIQCDSLTLYNKNGRCAVPFRPLNSRDPWPLYISFEDDDLPVFDDEGNLTPDILDWALVD
jgi:hypothetical protein